MKSFPARFQAATAAHLKTSCRNRRRVRCSAAVVSDRVARGQGAVARGCEIEAGRYVSESILTAKPVHDETNLLGERLLVADNCADSGSLVTARVHQCIHPTSKARSIRLSVACLALSNTGRKNRCRGDGLREETKCDPPLPPILSFRYCRTAT
jgi:hypothetical protein